MSHEAGFRLGARPYAPFTVSASTDARTGSSWAKSKDEPTHPTTKQTKPPPSRFTLDRQLRPEGPAPAVKATALFSTPEMDSQMSW